MNLSTNKISFLRDVHSSVEINMTSKWKYHSFNGFNIYEINTFIKSIDDGQIYLMIPLFTAINSEATLNLSDPFLIDNQSNPVLISTFIFDQWESSGFINNRKIDFLFKFKRVSYSYL